MSNKLAQALRSVLEWPLPQGTVESCSLPKWLAHDARAALAEHDATPQAAQESANPEWSRERVEAAAFSLGMRYAAPPAQPVLTIEQEREAFETAWAPFVAAGYCYGSDALEQVRFGWKIAQGLKP